MHSLVLKVNIESYWLPITIKICTFNCYYIHTGRSHYIPIASTARCDWILKPEYRVLIGRHTNVSQPITVRCRV